MLDCFFRLVGVEAFVVMSDNLFDLFCAESLTEHLPIGSDTSFCREFLSLSLFNWCYWFTHCGHCFLVAPLLRAADSPRTHALRLAAPRGLPVAPTHQRPFARTSRSGVASPGRRVPGAHPVARAAHPHQRVRPRHPAAMSSWDAHGRLCCDITEEAA